jgi:hypothetical protein
MLQPRPLLVYWPTVEADKTPLKESDVLGGLWLWRVNFLTRQVEGGFKIES